VSQVKCDERPNGCLNCERLQLNCVQNGALTNGVKRSNAALEPLGIKRKRTFRSCVACRDSKVKCSGERPTCTRCAQRMTTCVYDAETNEPAWVQSISSTVSAVTSPDATAVTQVPQIPRTAFSSAPTDLAAVNCPPGLTWYVPRFFI